jgi:hypothetical protein
MKARCLDERLAACPSAYHVEQDVDLPEFRRDGTRSGSRLSWIEQVYGAREEMRFGQG